MHLCSQLIWQHLKYLNLFRPMHLTRCQPCRAAMAGVCKRFCALSSSAHAAKMWRNLRICDTDTDLNSGSLIRWCKARAPHIRALDLAISASAPQVWRLRHVDRLPDWE